MGTTILVVDDEPLIRWGLQQRLQVHGYGVIAASSAEEALSLCGAHDNIALAVLDIRLPGRNGLALLEELRRLYRDCRAILVTAYCVDEVERGDAILDIVSKPFDLDHLVAMVDAYLEVVVI